MQNGSFRASLSTMIVARRFYWLEASSKGSSLKKVPYFINKEESRRKIRIQIGRDEKGTERGFHGQKFQNKLIFQIHLSLPIGWKLHTSMAKISSHGYSQSSIKNSWDS